MCGTSWHAIILPFYQLDASEYSSQLFFALVHLKTMIMLGLCPKTHLVVSFAQASDDQC